MTLFELVDESAAVDPDAEALAYALGFLTARHPDAALVAFEARFRTSVVAGDVVTPVEGEGGTFALRHADGPDAVTGRAELRRLAADGDTGFAFSSPRGQDRSPRSLSPRPRT
jgi:hypothetical protein